MNSPRRLLSGFRFPSFRFLSSEKGKRKDERIAESGFTLLEVLVCLTILAVGASLALSLISGSLWKIRKVQLKTQVVEHAEAVMELALLNDAIVQPQSYTGDFEDGDSFSVKIEDYKLPEAEKLQPPDLPQNAQNQIKLLCYTVELFSPDSHAVEYRLQTLKLVRVSPENQMPRI
jgi:prepilin-type N-terminal cleavage/methylation domain-containing protein